MATLALCDNFEVLNARSIDEWATINRIQDPGKVAFLLAGKVTAPILHTLKDRSSAHGSSIIDEAIQWLDLYTLKTFGVRTQSCVADVTSHIPLSGMVQEGLDVVRMVPALIGSAVGLKKIRDFAGDYLTTPTDKRIGKNGLLTLHDRPTVTVTNRDLIDLGLVTPPPAAEAYILELARNCHHKTPIVWVDRMARSKSRPLTKSDFDILAVQNPMLSRMLMEKLAST